MMELFLAICAFTALECDDVTVAVYQGFDEQTLAAAGYDDDGNYYLLIHPDSLEKSENFQKRLMVHEISHLIAFNIDKNNLSHYGIYEEICEELKELTEAGGRTTCEPYEDRPHYPWRTLRRE